MRSLLQRMVLVFLLVSLFPLSAYAQEDAATTAIFDFPRLDGITIDGNATDWGTRGFRIGLLVAGSEIRPPADFAPVVRWGWNQDGLLLLAQVHDKNIAEYETDTELWRMDGMEVYLATARGADERYQVALGTGADPKYPKLRWCLYDWRPDQAHSPALTIHAAATPMPGGYQVEALFPWQNLHVTPKTGDEIGVQIDIIDASDNGSACALWYPVGGAAFFPDLMYRVRLADHPSPPVTVAVCGTYKPGTPATLHIYADSDATGKRILVKAGERVLLDGVLTEDADGRLQAAIPLSLLRTERLGPITASVDGMPVSVLSQFVCDAPLPPEADGVDFAGVVRGLQLRAAQLWPKTSARLRQRHEGMVQYQFDQLAKLKVTDGRTWQEYTERVGLVRTILDGVSAKQDVLAKQRGRFEWAYLSTADGSAQPFTLTLPQEYDGTTALPLLVYLHGSGYDHRSKPMNWSTQSYLLLYVNGRGSPNYRCLGETEVQEATAFIRTQFPVDQKRVTVYGISMGGWGVLYYASRHPDDYAAVASFCGYGYGLSMDSLWNVPLQIHHGQEDTLCHVDEARLEVDTLQRLGANLHYYETPKEGHGGDHAAMAHDTFDFLLAAQYHPLPRELRHATDQPMTRGTCRWAAIVRLDDPQAVGCIHLTCTDTTLSGDTVNVATLRLSQVNQLFPGRQALEITMDGQTLTVPLKETLWLIKQNTVWHVTAQEPSATTYQRGGYECVYDGQPLRVVVPLGWQDQAETKALVTACSTCADMHHVMPYGSIPVVRAGSFTAKDFRGHLILIGDPETNPVLAKLLPQWPVRFTPETVEVLGVGVYPRGTTAISLTYRNPYAPGRRICWLYNETSSLAPFDSFFAYRPDGVPDIVIYDRATPEPTLLAAANFGQDWTLPQLATAPVLAKEIKTATDLLCETTRVAMRRLHADYAVVQIDEWRDKAALGEGRLTLGTLQAIMPAGQQTVVRARLTATQLADVRARMKDDPMYQWLSDGEPAPDKEYYDVVFLEQLIDSLNWTERYTKPNVFSFPPGTLTRTDLDLRDVLPDVVK